MTDKRLLKTCLLITGAFALAGPGAAQAHPAGDDRYGHEMHAGPGMCDMQPGERWQRRHEDRNGPDGERLPPMLRGVELSDSQREQVRGIMRTQAEDMRTRGEELRQTREALRNLALSEDYSEAKLKELAAAHGRAVAALAEQHALSARRIHQLLTPEQRKQLEERRKDCEEQRRKKAGDGDTGR